MQSSLRGYRGMQVHAVPDNDRAFDSSGRKLPWGYDVSANSNHDSNQLVEKGPFGRSQRRSRSGMSRSRSKTAEPRREEDKFRAEQLAAEDAVFGSLRRVAKEEGRREALGEVDSNTVTHPVASSVEGEGEATEVLLYGFGEDLQWAAIDHYERVSSGIILEDYDRQPAGPRYDISRSLSRATSQRSLSKAALQKKNRFAGGEHWIKVTFDSRSAAELACACSPHILKGHLVYAELYQRRGPGKDEAIIASQAGAQITDSVMPQTFRQTAMEASPNGSSTTATSATVIARRDEESRRSTSTSSTFDDVFTRQMPQLAAKQPAPAPAPAPIPSRLHQISTNTHLTHRRPRLEGTTPALVLPASAAMLPKQPKRSWSAYFGTSEVIGSIVPKRDDGTFDWERASLYWRIFYWVDNILGTDFCGMKGD